MSRRETHCVAATGFYFHGINAAVFVMAPPFVYSHLKRGDQLDVWTSREIGMHCSDAGRDGATACRLR
jgi:hypothetical protein